MKISEKIKKYIKWEDVLFYAIFSIFICGIYVIGTLQ